MLEVEIQKLTAAIQEMTVQLKGTNALLMEARANAKTVTAAKKPYREDEAHREGLQAARDKAVEDEAPKKETSKKAVKPVAIDQEPAQDTKPVEPEPSSHITADSLKTVAMELVRADSSARSKILEILGEHGAKTITQLDPKSYGPVHHALLGLAEGIFNKSEAV